MHVDHQPSKPTMPAPRFAIGENVARTMSSFIRRLDDELDREHYPKSVVGAPSAPDAGLLTREAHQIAAMHAAKMVAHQYTREAKKQCKRACLAHLIASLAPTGGVQE